MNACRCTDVKHPTHPGHICERFGTEPDGCCKQCHDLAAASKRESAQPKPAH